VDACARYGVGSLLNSFLPARLGDAARVTLFARTLPAGEGVLLVSAGAFAAIEIAHVTVQAVVLAVASAVFPVPVWPLAALAACVTAVVGTIVILRPRINHRRVRLLLDGINALLRDSQRGARVLGWLAAATACRVAAAAAIAASLGLHSPFTAAVIVTAALDLAGLLPLAPGNIGVASAAVALALQQAGVAPPAAIAAGLALQGVQTLVGVAFGLVSTALVTASSATVPHPRRVRLGAAAASLTAVAALALLPVLS
jgi:uncharacterized membrane protein YbhN (UPF0104 family)